MSTTFHEESRAQSSSFIAFTYPDNPGITSSNKPCITFANKPGIPISTYAWGCFPATLLIVCICDTLAVRCTSSCVRCQQPSTVSVVAGLSTSDYILQRSCTSNTTHDGPVINAWAENMMEEYIVK